MKKKSKNKDIIFGSSRRVFVQVRVGFDLKIYVFFGFSLFWARVAKTVFKIQNFQANSN